MGRTCRLYGFSMLLEVYLWEHLFYTLHGNFPPIFDLFPFFRSCHPHARCQNVQVFQNCLSKQPIISRWFLAEIWFFKTLNMASIAKYCKHVVTIFHWKDQLRLTSLQSKAASSEGFPSLTSNTIFLSFVLRVVRICQVIKTQAFEVLLKDWPPRFANGTLVRMAIDIAFTQASTKECLSASKTLASALLYSVYPTIESVTLLEDSSDKMRTK